jgi:quercetin dioxygenase-like cupin family protein
VNGWDLAGLQLSPHAPEILFSKDDARAIVLEIPDGEQLADHQVHERAWVVVISGEVEITTADGESTRGGPGLMVEFAPAERHAVRALSTARLLLLLTPFPGPGHPGAMTLEQKAAARERAAERASAAS